MAQENQEQEADKELEAEVDRAIEAVRGPVVEESAPVSEQPAQDAAEPEVSQEQPELDGGTEAAAAAETPDAPWFSDSDKELASGYGHSVEDFGSREEFSRFTRLLDKQLLNAASRLQAPPPVQETPQHNQNGHGQAQLQPPPTQPSAPSTPKFSKYDIAKLKESGWDEQLISQAETINALIDDRELTQQERAAEKQQFEQVQQYVERQTRERQELEQQHEANAFHAAIDRLGDEARFGKIFDEFGRVNKISDQQVAARLKVREMQLALHSGHLQQSLPLPNYEQLVLRAKHVAFAEDIAKEAVAKRNQEIADQSRKRRPVQQARNPSGQFSTRKNGAPLTQSERQAAIANEMREYHTQLLQESNGVTA